MTWSAPIDCSLSNFSALSTAFTSAPKVPGELHGKGAYASICREPKAFLLSVFFHNHAILLL
jgi:hypothetical protein